MADTITICDVIKHLEATDCIGDIYFDYNGSDCGLGRTVDGDGYHQWYNGTLKTYKTISDMINDPFYGKKSFIDIFNSIYLMFV